MQALSSSSSASADQPMQCTEQHYGEHVSASKRRTRNDDGDDDNIDYVVSAYEQRRQRCSQCRRWLLHSVSLAGIVPPVDPDDAFCNYSCARSYYLALHPASRVDYRLRIQEAFAPYVSLEEHSDTTPCVEGFDKGALDDIDDLFDYDDDDTHPTPADAASMQTEQ